MAPTRSSSRRSTTDIEPEKSNVSLSPKAALVAAPETSHYEQTRLENIKRNEMFLANLGISSLHGSSLLPVPAKKPASASKPKVKKVSAPAEPIIMRRSSRVTSEKLVSEIKALKDAGKKEEMEAKQKELDELLASKAASQTFAEEYFAAESSERRERIMEAVSLTTTLSEEAVDTSFLQHYFPYTPKAVNSSTKSKATKTTVKQEFSDNDFASLTLAETDVVKLTPTRMTSVALHPSSHKFLAAGGDKTGVLTLWDVDAHRNNHHDAGDENNDTTNNIFQYKPHISNVTKLTFTPQSLFSTSYDGTVRRLDLSSQQFQLAFVSPDSLSDSYFTDSSFMSYQLNMGVEDGETQTMLISQSTGDLGVVDTRVSVTDYQHNYNICDSKLASVDVHPLYPHLILTSSARSGMFLHDIRKISSAKNNSVKPLWAQNTHSKSINAAVFSPNGEYFVSVSLDDTIQTFRFQDTLIANNSNNSSTSTITVSRPHVTRHNNFTGRWLSTFKPVFDVKRPATFAMGAMLQPRRIEIYSVVHQHNNNNNNNNNESYATQLVANLANEYLASVNSRLAFHPTVNAVLGSNSSGKVHLFR